MAKRKSWGWQMTSEYRGTQSFTTFPAFPQLHFLLPTKWNRGHPTFPHSPNTRDQSPQDGGLEPPCKAKVNTQCAAWEEVSGGECAVCACLILGFSTDPLALEHNPKG